MSSRPFVSALALCALSVPLAACSSSSTPSSSGTGTSGSHPTPSAVVEIKFVSFLPGKVTIHAGQTVEWKWEDSPVSHNVTFSGFSTTTQTDGTFFHTFDTPGTYNYTCTVHATMNGEVVVLP